MRNAMARGKDRERRAWRVRAGWQEGRERDDGVQVKRARGAAIPRCESGSRDVGAWHAKRKEKEIAAPPRQRDREEERKRETKRKRKRGTARKRGREREHLLDVRLSSLLPRQPCLSSDIPPLRPSRWARANLCWYQVKMPCTRPAW
jgi:hypothetical protein